MVKINTCALFCSLFLLTSCQNGAEISVNTANDIPIFTIKANGEDKPCVGGISVDEKIGTSSRPVWAIQKIPTAGSNNKQHCQSVFLFGKTPKGYQDQAKINRNRLPYSGEALQPGHNYIVSIVDSAYDDATEFTVDKVGPS
jgi:hypothetical protein